MAPVSRLSDNNPDLTVCSFDDSTASVLARQRISVQKHQTDSKLANLAHQDSITTPGNAVSAVHQRTVGYELRGQNRFAPLIVH